MAKGGFALAEKGAGDVVAAELSVVAKSGALLVGLSLGQDEAEEDDEHGRTRAEPEQRSPTVRGGVDESSGKGCSQEITEGVALLEDAAHETPRILGEVFNGGGGCVPVQTAHGHAEEGATCEELAIGVAESCAL